MKRPQIIVIEEMHYMAADESRTDIGGSSLATLFATAGKRNIRFFLSNQVMSGISPQILANIRCRVVMGLTNPACIWTAQRSMGLTPEQSARIPELETREIIVQYGEHPHAFKVHVDEIVLPGRPEEPELEAVAQEFLEKVHVTVDTGESLSGASDADAKAVLVRLATHSAENIEDRCKALGMERKRELGARKRLEDRGLIEEEQLTLPNGFKFQRITAKGEEWMKGEGTKGVKVRRPKSGPAHAYLLDHVERTIGALNPRFSFQKHSEIAPGLEPDSVVHLPEGRRIVLEICFSNPSYEAANLLKETHVEGVDMVIAVALNRNVLESLQEAVRAAGPAQEEGAKAAPLVILDAASVLDKDFDWVSVLERPT